MDSFKNGGDDKTGVSKTPDDGEYAESEYMKIRDDLKTEGAGTWSVWNTNMDIEERDLVDSPTSIDIGGVLRQRFDS